MEDAKEENQHRKSSITMQNNNA